MPSDLIDAYRALPRVSNSDLTRLKEERLGSGAVHPQAQANLQRASIFGRAFHQHLLEPERVGTVMQQLLPDLTPGLLESAPDPGQLQTLMHIVQQDAFCRRYLRQAERERIVLSTDPATSIACKARMDLLYTSPQRRSALIVDLKTTSARTPAQFLESCYTYDYDRQAAFYLDSLRQSEGGEWADTRQFRFVFVGVMKQAPHRLFAVDATSIPGFIDYGRKKYRFWLRKWREEQQTDTRPLVGPLPAWQRLA
ncbi:hypothetical protein GCM10027578_43400 [Spirosoma luteolum]